MSQNDDAPVEREQISLSDLYHQLDDRLGPDQAPYDVGAGLERLVSWMSEERPTSPVGSSVEDLEVERLVRDREEIHLRAMATQRIASSGSDDGPVARFCARLRQLREASDVTTEVLLQRLKTSGHEISQAQLYHILAGGITRPPDWETRVRPIVSACTAGDPVAIDHWRREHAILVGVYEQLRRYRNRDNGPGKTVKPSTTVSTLRADTAAFTGRHEQIEDIRRAVSAAGSPGRQVTVIAIEGMPGVGKTTLAVHVGHLLAGRFPDGQLFVELHAYSKARPPADPAEELASLLRAFGIPPGDIPEEGEQRAVSWRKLTAGKKLVLILDDAASDAQVAPLIPGSADCLVLVTSRRRLTGLRSDYGVRALPLDILPEPEAVDLFNRVGRRSMTAADEKSTIRLVRACGYLPLAINILAASLDQTGSVQNLLDELNQAQDCISVIDAQLADLAKGVVAAFDLSYGDLDAGDKRMLRLLSSIPGPDIDTYAAAALADLPPDKARASLRRLSAVHLIEQSDGRYRLHDLVSTYGRTVTRAEEPAPAIKRIADYYQGTAEAASAYLSRYTRATAGRATGNAARPDFASRNQAHDWMSSERQNLLACITYAKAHEDHSSVIGLAAAVSAYLQSAGPWAQAVEIHSAAASAAATLGDRAAQADALHDLGVARYLIEDFPAAATALDEAERLYQGIGNRLGAANCRYQLGTLRKVKGDHAQAKTLLEEALGSYRAIGDSLGEANALNQLGAAAYMADNYPDAIAALELSLEKYREVGNQPGEATALIYLGAVRDEMGDYRAASDALRKALEIYRTMGEPLGEANALNQLGSTLQMTGEYADAIAVLQRALAIYGQLGNRISEANALNRLGAAFNGVGDYMRAASALQQALDFYRATGNRQGEADVLSDFGVCHQGLGDVDTADTEFGDALDIFRALRERLGEAQTLNRQGVLYRKRHALSQAETCHRRALALARTVDSQLEEARAQEGIGKSAVAEADRAAAMQEAKVIYQRIGHPDVTRLADDD